MRLFKYIVALWLILVVVPGVSRTLYVPHIHTGSDVWETYLVAENEDGAKSHSFTLTVYAADGSVVLDSQSYTVSAGSRLLVSLRGFGGVDGEVECGSLSMRFRVSYQAREDTGGGTAEFELPSALKQTAVFSPSDYLGNMTWSGYAVMNAGNDSITVSVKLLKTDGTSVSWGSFSISPHGKAVNYFEDAFGVPMDQLTSVIMTADYKTLAGITITGNENDKLLFTGAGTTRSGWSYTTAKGRVYGVASGASNDFAVEYGPLSTKSRKGTSTNVYLTAVNHVSGDKVGKSPIFSQRVYPRGVISSSDGSVVLIYGVDAADSNDPHYFISKVNTAGAALLWTKELDSNLYTGFSIDGNFDTKIVAATSGTTIEVALVDDNKHEVWYLLNSSDGSQIDRQEISTPSSRIPCALVYDTVHGIYAGLGTAVDDGSLKVGGTGKYSHVYLMVNDNTSLQGVPTYWDESGIINDSNLHNVFIAGATVNAGDLYFVMMADIGEDINYNGLMFTGFQFQPAQVVAAHVDLGNIYSPSLDTVLSFKTGQLLDKALCAADGTGGVIAIFPGSYSYSGSTIFRFDTDIADDGFNSFRLLAALSYKVDDIAFSHGDLLIGAEIPTFSVGISEKSVDYLEFTSDEHAVVACASLSDWGTSGFSIPQ